MNKFLAVTLYTVMLLTSFFQLETPDSQHAKVQDQINMLCKEWSTPAVVKPFKQERRY